MLKFCDGRRSFGRRAFLQIAPLGIGAAAWPNVFGSSAAAAEIGRATATGRSVIFLFLHGGPSQFETFDPKMTAPVDIRSTTGELSTRLPGVTFGGSFPRLAQLADRLSIVRSFTTGDSRHDIKPVVHTDTLQANIGSIYSRIVGTNDPRSGMPTNAMLFPRAVEPDSQPGQMNFGSFTATGTLGSAQAPFVPGSGGELQEAMKLSLPMNRLDDRRALLAGLDRLQHRLDTSELLASSERIREQAFQTMLGGVADAFDLSQEDPKTVARYDTAPLVRPENISTRWNNRKYYIDNAKTLGKLLLLARRLVEAGSGFVTVTTNFVWDMHADVNNASMEEGMAYMGGPLDHALSAYLEDVESRGLSEKILLVVCGEMGRTPRINKGGGRDHWGSLAPLLLAGGGLKMGQVIGRSSRHGAEPASEPMTIKHLVSTILNTQFNVGELRLAQDVPGEVARTMTGWPPIPGLL